jgi:phospholipase/carboxylesterase
VREFGEPVLRLKDPDGVIVKLVGTNLPASRPWSDAAHAIRRLRAVAILTDKPEMTAAFVGRFGYRPGPVSGNIQRMLSDTDAVDIRDATGYVPGIPGTGTADHVAFRAADVAAVRVAEFELSRLEASPTSFRDRKYFTSLYVREPGGTLMELATDGPGFTVDESLECLGQTLFMPPDDADRAEELRVMLPQFALPGEERQPMRELPFVHRFHVPDDPDGSTIVLLHGTGGNEADLMPLAHRIAPRATLLGVRGRSHEEGVARWFRRLTMTSFRSGRHPGGDRSLRRFRRGCHRGLSTGCPANDLSRLFERREFRRRGDGSASRRDPQCDPDPGDGGAGATARHRSDRSPCSHADGHA